MWGMDMGITKGTAMARRDFVMSRETPSPVPARGRGFRARALDGIAIDVR